mgnify:CR=1 FL=1
MKELLLTQINANQTQINADFQSKYLRPSACNLRESALKFLIFVFVLYSFPCNCAAQEKMEAPVTVNGDTVEYDASGKDVVAIGNVSVQYKGSKLTCDKLTVNTTTKDSQAEGHVRIEDAKGVMEGERGKYNFNAKSGSVENAEFRSSPYFGKAKNVQKISDAEFIANRGYFTSCDYQKPHYRIKAKTIDFFPEDKVITKNAVFYVQDLPLAYLKKYSHSLKEPMMHVQFMPGKSKDWGAFLLSAWRYQVTDHVQGRIYADYREKLGSAEGFGANYDTDNFGRGDFKFYYTQERPKNFNEGDPAEFERYLVRSRHKWDIDERTNLVSEYYKITDSKRVIYGGEYSILKDYFYREYEKDTQPSSYALYHHAFDYSGIDVMVQKRVNRWYSSYTEKLPEIKYNLSSVQVGETPFYFEHNSSLANLNQKNAVHSSPEGVNLTRFDTTNKISLPTKVSFLQFRPFAGTQETFYDKGADGESIAPRTMFLAGADVSTKFYRVFNLKSEFLKMQFNGLRHVITPTIGYTYQHDPTVSSNHIRQIDGIDSLSRSNSASLGLSNKLQTKRDNKSVDFADFNITNAYTFKTEGNNGGNLGNFLFDLTVLPYSWMRFDTDATYDHRNDYFTNANYDVNFNLASNKTIGLGQRYQRKGGNEITNSFDWRFTPKWRLALYQRRNIGHDPSVKKGLREQEYTISRDLHCWQMDFSYNVKRGEGETIWLIFRLKAFPEMEFVLDQSYHGPKAGSQSNS